MCSSDLKSAAAIEEIAGKYGFNKETYPYEQNPKEKLQETKQQLSVEIGRASCRERV